MRILATTATCLAAAVVSISGVLVWANLGTATAGAASGSSAFTTTETVTRTDVAPDGTTSTVATNTVTLSVSQTADLEGRQEITVSWSGAHPTGGIVADENSVEAQYEEYPMVLLECRDTATTSTVESPETCWTQSWTERYQDSNTSGLYPPYRLDEYGTHGEVVGRPTPLPATSTCQGDSIGKLAAPVQYWVPWEAADGTVYDGGVAGACGQPPEADSGITGALPSNETFGVTGKDGTGSAEFDVFTSTENATLGCSSTVPCSLVAVPIEGISCDGTALGASPTKIQLSDLTVCEETGDYTAGAAARTQTFDNGADLAVTGSLWWSPSNWRNRIVVPLTIAPLPTACSLTGSRRQIQAYGSELMVQATNQWDPSFCADGTDGFSFSEVYSSEPEARNLVADGAVDAAFTSYAQPGGYGKPVANAPVAVTGFTISYAISLPTGGTVTTLKLTPLLLAKLLTDSYRAMATPSYDDPTLAGNPLNITDDPEFHALNPEIPENATGSGPGIAESELVSIASNSDVIEALTTYIDDTPAARAFLNGTPDTSMGEHMVVNPAYRGIQLPVDQWPLLSSYVSTAFDNSTTIAPCLGSAVDPAGRALYTLIDAPMTTLEDVSEAMQFKKPNSTTDCSPAVRPTKPGTMTTSGRQEAGHYFMIGITPLADDQRNALRAAELETTPGTFVAPTSTTLKSAAALLKPDATTGTWPIPYGTFQTAAGASAYPGTMVVYAAIPTSGLTATDAQDYAAFLTFAATTGQTSGPGVGELPAGYLPLTATDDLGALQAYTLAAAADVAAQNGQVPSLGTATTPGSGTTPSSTSPPGSTSGSPPSSNPVSRSTVSPDQVESFPTVLTLGTLSLDRASTPASTGTQGESSRHERAGARSKLVELSPTADDSLWIGSLPVALVLGLAALAIAATPILYRAGRRRGRW